MDRLLQHRAFEIVEPTDDFDPNFKPEDGIQYLQQVAHERSRCPEVVICPFQDSSESVISSFSPSAQTSNDVSVHFQTTTPLSPKVYIIYTLLL